MFITKLAAVAVSSRKKVSGLRFAIQFVGPDVEARIAHSHGYCISGDAGLGVSVAAGKNKVRGTCTWEQQWRSGLHSLTDVECCDPIARTRTHRA